MTEFKNTPEEARKLWVEALRSGPWEQAHECLGIDDACCCLGVACELFNLHESWLRIIRDDDIGNSYDGKDTTLPEIVRDWLGLTTVEGLYKSNTDGLPNALTYDNEQGKSFTEIADIIESAPEGLFVMDASEAGATA